MEFANGVLMGQKDPAAQAPEVWSSPPTQKDPAGHGVHSSTAAREVEVEYVPGGHAT